jgi:chitosanase
VLSILVTSMFTVLAGVGCGQDEADGPWPAATTGPSTVTLSGAQRHITDELVSVFENATTEPAYDYVENLADGRGFTCGKIGFTTSSTEVRDVVSAFAGQRPDTALARHLPRLIDLAATGSADTAGLDGFAADWAGAAADPAFRSVQDTVADRIAFDPALATARRLGVRTALGVAIVYDTVVQHGSAEDPDGTPALVAEAGRSAGGLPADGVPEQRWLTALLTVREDHLRHAAEPATRKKWAESVERVVVLRTLVSDSRHRLTPPITVHVYGSRFVLT